MEDIAILWEPNFFQTDFDIMHVDAPSSMMHRWMVTFWIVTRIWNDTSDCSCISKFSNSKVINHDYEGPIAHNEEIKPFQVELDMF